MSIMIFHLGLCITLLAFVAAQKQYNSTSHRIKLEGGVGYYYYYVNLYVGNPPQRQALIIDTGSPRTIFPCSDCQVSKCGTHLNKPFEYKLSSTYHPLMCQDKFENYLCNCPASNETNSCTFSQYYLEGSGYEGFYMRDKVIFGDELYDTYQNQTLIDIENTQFSDIQADFMFGCATSETNMLFRQKANGILGLGPITNELYVQPNLIDMVFKNHNHINEKLEFSLCLATKSGYMQIGGYDTKDHYESGNNIKINYDTNLVQQQYGISLHGLRINNQTMNETISTFIDSGTTFTYLPATYYDFVMNFINEHCNDPEHCLGEKNRQICYQYNQNNTNITIEQFFNSFPTIYFQFDDNQEFEWQPMDYFYEKNLYNFCISIERGSNPLGQTFMRYNDILFDRENKQIVIKKANCGDYIFGNGEKYVPTIADIIRDTISELDPTIIIIILAAGILLVIFIIIFVIKKYCTKQKLESDEKVMIDKDKDNENNDKNKQNDIEQQARNFQIGDKYGQNIEMAYKDIYEEKLDDDDNSKVKGQLDDFQKFNFETN